MTDRKKILDLFNEQEHVWKKRVTDGIESYRKGNAELTVVFEDGRPAVGARVNAVQISHEFGFGANLFMLDGFESEQKIQKSFFRPVQHCYNPFLLGRARTRQGNHQIRRRQSLHLQTPGS